MGLWGTRATLASLPFLLIACGAFGSAATEDAGAPEAASTQCPAGSDPCFEAGKTVCRDLKNDGAACGACGHACWDGPGSLSPACRDGECGHVVFVTSTEYVGSALGDLVGADEKCEALGGKRFGSGKLRAWLSTTRVAARDRVGPARGAGKRAYVLPDGTPVAPSWEAFTRPDHLAPIGVDESGAKVTGNPNVWTASTAEGTFVARGTDGDCNNWGPVPSTAAFVGVLTEANASAWTRATEAACNLSARLYCIQD